jgi:antitoxin component YwqK of YwqJK toxin-antitoxin module
MEKKSFILTCLLILILISCHTENETEVTKEKDPKADSISKAQQKIVVDSLKAKNPLLIMPPDSTYTGQYVDKYNTGITKFKGTYRFGKKHGQWMSFYPTGLAWSEMHFDKGLREGPNIAYFENGKTRYSGFYKSDGRDSVWLYFDSIGNLAEKVLFKNDKVVKKLPIK